MKFFRAILGYAGIAAAVSRTSPPSGALVVGDGHYQTVQSAVNALSLTSTSPQAIFINPGTYQEQVYVQAMKGPLTIYGYTNDTSSYQDNEVTITASHALSGEPNDDATATLRVWTSNFKMYNVNVKNTFGEAEANGQALALSGQKTGQGYYGCGFYGYQDTILAETGAQLYAKSYIEGATDFIFGQRAEAWFDGCDIGVLSAKQGYVTASGRSTNDSSIYVINNSSIAAAPGQNVAAGAFYLGRPWGTWARVIVQNTYLTNVINSAGWHVWSTSAPHTEDVTFEEYHNTGPGSQGQRVSFSSKASSAISISTVLGAGYADAVWVDASYL